MCKTYLGVNQVVMIGSLLIIGTLSKWSNTNVSHHQQQLIKSPTQNYRNDTLQFN